MPRGSLATPAWSAFPLQPPCVLASLTVHKFKTLRVVKTREVLQLFSREGLKKDSQVQGAAIYIYIPFYNTDAWNDGVQFKLTKISLYSKRWNFCIIGEHNLSLWCIFAFCKLYNVKICKGIPWKRGYTDICFRLDGTDTDALSCTVSGVLYFRKRWHGPHTDLQLELSHWSHLRRLPPPPSATFLYF